MALASAFVGGNTKPLYISGGNDNAIALWDVSGSSGRPHRHSGTADGEFMTWKASGLQQLTYE